MATFKVMFHGKPGKNTQIGATTEIVEGFNTPKGAKDYIKRVYGDVVIDGSTRVGGEQVGPGASESGWCEGPRNKHGKQTVPDSTWAEMNNTNVPSSSGHSDSGEGGFLSGVGTLLVLGLVGVGLVMPKDNTPPPAPAPVAPVEAPVSQETLRVTEANCARFLTATECSERFPAPLTAEQLQTPPELRSPCAQWAAAHPDLARQLRPGATCYGY